MIAPAAPPVFVRALLVVEPLPEVFFLVVVLELLCEDDDEDEEEEEEVVGDVGVVVDVCPAVTVADGVVDVVVGVHDADTLLTGPMFGGTRADGGVPGAALTLKVRTWPVARVTVTVH